MEIIVNLCGNFGMLKTALITKAFCLRKIKATFEVWP
jgi:hypothetical protein